MALSGKNFSTPRVQAVITRIRLRGATAPFPVPISDTETFFFAHKTSIRTNHMITTARKLAMPKMHPAKVNSRMSPYAPFRLIVLMLAYFYMMDRPLR